MPLSLVAAALLVRSAAAHEGVPGVDNTNWIYLHGVLMSLGWVAMLPGEGLCLLQWEHGVNTLYQNGLLSGLCAHLTQLPLASTGPNTQQIPN